VYKEQHKITESTQQEAFSVAVVPGKIQKSKCEFILTLI
jgi:hypothetical protein